MSLFSLFRKKQPEATSVAEALSGATSTSSTKSRKRATESRQLSGQEQQLVSERKRARRRLIGAVVMVLAVIIGVPMVLDSEPKSSEKNILIQIPSKDLPPLLLDQKEDVTTTESTAPVFTRPSTPASKLAGSSVGSASHSEVEASSNSAREVGSAGTTGTHSVKSTDNVNNKTDAKSSSAILAKKEVPVKKKDTDLKNDIESARALAILDGSDLAGGENAERAKKESAKENTRIVVQIGAFATQEKVNELRDKLTSAGIQSYTQKVGTNSGDKIRVRIGPFSDRESADKARMKLEKLGLNGSLITL